MTVKTREEHYNARHRAGYLTPLLIFACLKYQAEVQIEGEIVEMMMIYGSEVVLVQLLEQ